MTVLTGRFDDALSYASALHRTQRRKGTDIPYISHLMSVSALVLEDGGDEDEAIAALLHDAVEDQGGLPRLEEIEVRFGAHVARIVMDCTDAVVEPKPDWQTRKAAYLASLEHKDASSLRVSNADKLHNARAIATDHAMIGEAIWDRFSQPKARTLWYYTSLAEAFLRLRPGPLAERLHAVVSDLSRA